MNGYMNRIDTDAAIGTILSHFDSEYINHVISDSLNMKFRPFDPPMPNMVDVLNRQFESIILNSPDYINEVRNVQTETYKEIINMICSYYNLTFTGDFDSMNPQEMYGAAHTLYDIFISRFTEYMINFFVHYIINNSDSIYAYLNSDENSKKPKENGAYSKSFIDPKFIIIHANINQVIYNMASYDISLQEMIGYFVDRNSADYLISVLQDNNDIYKNHYASYIIDQRYSAGVLTNIKLNLQSRTQEALNITTK